jgi:uracil-DNA glycosylase
MVAILPRKSARRRPGKVRAVSSRIRKTWAQLSREIRTCQRCPLGHTRTQAVVYRGGLAPRVVFVGEAPGVLEDRTGIPFVGRSGRRLDAAIERLGLEPSEFGVLNVLKCHPPRNRFDRAAAHTCRPYLDRQLALLRPEAVVTLGASALHAFDPRAPPILTVAGRPRPSATWRVFPLLHPAATLRSRRWAKRWESDLEALGAWLGVRRA